MPQVRAVFEEVCQRFGLIRVLINNAGISGANKPTHELTEDEWDQVQAVNVKGVLLCTKHAVPPMKQAGGGSMSICPASTAWWARPMCRRTMPARERCG
jgi:NAD(P)-dependent dehydrogenase (short-subunit alcohol dehydrogenase family)